MNGILRTLAQVLACCGSLTAQAAINVSGAAYPVKPDPIIWLDGAGGALSLAAQDAGAAGRANAANVPWVALKSNCDAFVARPYTDPFADYVPAIPIYYARFANAALCWWATGAPANDPYGYAAAARYGLLHLENMAGGTFGCDTSGQYCNGRSADLDAIRLYTAAISQAYSILSAGNFLSAEDKAVIRAKFLNDNTTAHNGIDSSACTNPGTPAGTGILVSSGASVTISGGDTSQLAVGGVILSRSNVVLAVVTSITDATHFVVNRSVSWSGIPFDYARPWQSGDCGLIWFEKHHNAAPPLVPGQERSYNADYFNGNSFVTANGNLTLTALQAYIAVGMAFAKDDPRAALLAQQSIDYYLSNQYAYALSSYVGFTSGGAAYTGNRTGWMTQSIAAILKNSLVDGPDLATGKAYAKKIIPYTYYTALPDNPQDMLTFQDVYGAKATLRPMWFGMWWAAGSAEAGYGNYFMRNVRADWTVAALNGGPSCSDSLCSYLPWVYIFTDPAAPSSDLSIAPTQYLFADPDYSTCVAGGYNCYANASTSHAISKSGWGPNDSVVLSQFAYIDPQNNDHSGVGNWGSVHIYRNGYLLAGDGYTSVPGRYGNGNLQFDNMISLGSDANWGYTSGNATMYRWAGEHPTGDPQSRYSYVMMDITGDYKATANAVRVQRHVIHFKTPGSQDYVVWYDDIATSAGGVKKAYLHFYHADCYNQPACADGFAGITWLAGNDGGTIISTQARSRLLTTVVGSAGPNTAFLGRDNGDGTYPGGNGYTYRAFICAENPSVPGSCDAGATTGEWIVVFKPSVDTSDTMPEITQLFSPRFRVVQIADDRSPKVAAFATGGKLYSSVSFTSTHAGIGQYVVTGIKPGKVMVLLNGTPISGSPFSIVNGDNSVSWEGGAGNYTIAPEVFRAARP